MNSTNRPYFLWDYDLTEDEVRQILKGTNETERRWMLARVLTSASFADVWHYTNVKQVVSEFPYLRMRPGIKSAWAKALHAWGYHV